MPTAPAHSIGLDRSHIVHLPTSLALEPFTVDAAYWSAMIDRPELADGRILSVFDYALDWRWWERHPSGDELAYVIDGEMEILLYDGSNRWSEPLTPQRGAIVPRTVWHSARVPTWARVLFITPTPALTEHWESKDDPKADGSTLLPPV